MNKSAKSVISTFRSKFPYLMSISKLHRLLIAAMPIPSRLHSFPSCSLKVFVFANASSASRWSSDPRSAWMSAGVLPFQESARLLLNVISRTSGGKARKPLSQRCVKAIVVVAESIVNSWLCRVVLLLAGKAFKLKNLPRELKLNGWIYEERWKRGNLSGSNSPWSWQ